MHRRWGSASCVLPETRLLKSASAHRSRGEGAVEGAGLLTRGTCRHALRPLRSIRSVMHSVIARLPARDHLVRRSLSRFSTDDARSALRSPAPRVPTLLAVSRPKARHALVEPFTIDPISECLRRP